MQYRTVKESSTSHYTLVFMLPVVLWVRTSIADCHIVAMFSRSIARAEPRQSTWKSWNDFSCVNESDEGKKHVEGSFPLHPYKKELYVEICPAFCWQCCKVQMMHLLASWEREVQLPIQGTTCYTHSPPNSIPLARSAATCLSLAPPQALRAGGTSQLPQTVH